MPRLDGMIRNQTTTQAA